MLEQQGNVIGKKCANKRGFFVIRRCNRPAVIKCPILHMYVCDECSVTYEGKQISRPAYVQLMKESNKDQLYSKDKYQYYYDTDEVLWYHFMRDDFYHSNNYEPFNSYDSQGFSDGGTFGGGEFGGAGASGAWDDESGAGSLYDS